MFTFLFQKYILLTFVYISVRDSWTFGGHVIDVLNFEISENEKCAARFSFQIFRFCTRVRKKRRLAEEKTVADQGWENRRESISED